MEQFSGDCVPLSCHTGNCSSTTWLFIRANSRETETLIEYGKVKGENNKERLHVTMECTLVVKKMTEEDEGQYICREYAPSRRYIDHSQYDLKLMSKYLHFNLLT